MACKLRHEREEHGLQGHGDRPFECPHPTCARSKRGNGFKRPYNCQDHVNRIHKGQIPPESPVAAKVSKGPKIQQDAKRGQRARIATTKVSTAQPSASRATRSGRKPSELSNCKDTVIARSAQIPASNLDLETQRMLDRWREQYETIHTLVHRVDGIHDTFTLGDLEKTSKEFISLAQELRSRVPAKIRARV